MTSQSDPEQRAFRATFIERLPLAGNRPYLGYGGAIALSVVALWLRWEMDWAFPPGYPFLTFFPAVILSSFLFGPRPGILAGLLCGAFAWYFFVAPRVGPIITARTITSMLFYAGVVTIDIVLVHLMQRANRRLADARENVRLLAEERGQLAERAQVLFQELQHRVGNNLQMVGAVLALQLRTLKEPTARQAISDAAARLTVIGRIQRQLYSPDGRMVALDTFIRQVAEAVMASSGRPGTECRIEAEEGIDVGSESAVPIALILTEAIANALEHALPDGANGVIEIDVRREGELVALTVRDHGAGLPDGFSIDAVDSIGLRISRVLSEQLLAEYRLDNSHPGTRMALRIPAAQLVRSPP
ncbi:sensor histidine kinase [Novosphingobium colocasiae]|uniref:histidine kinase n=1 Tax=Novosphingobium colocasiae TaxID=1256513 RepID=A0A918PD80_9SPHN|nr:histidine kinase dimerization/phosphoacceptor domain -containing protein [Novosphingobium colocasiae]GGY98101.1 sensor histidine kinase [Novosphingobium colocasiae]